VIDRTAMSSIHGQSATQTRSSGVTQYGADCVMDTNQTDDVRLGADGAVVNQIRSFDRSFVPAVFYIL
jgi:hypothetical protein